MPVKFSFEIPEGAKVVVPISMNSDVEGEKLKDIIEALKELKCDITVLIADGLQKHNIGQAAALKLGDDFVARNEQILKDIKKVRWDEYIDSKKESFKKTTELVESIAKPGSLFYDKMVKTQEMCSVSKDLEKSLKYQKEEYAAILTMSEFDYLIYRNKITVGMAWLYKEKEFTEVKKPTYAHVSFKSSPVKSMQSSGIFKLNDKRHENSLPFALRLAYENLEALLTTSEISDAAKKIFKDQVTNLFILTDEEANKKQKTNKLVMID